jgi:hypothetical protein
VLEVDLQGRVARLAADAAAPATANGSREEEQVPVDDQVSGAIHSSEQATAHIPLPQTQPYMMQQWSATALARQRHDELTLQTPWDDTHVEQQDHRLDYTTQLG